MCLTSQIKKLESDLSKQEQYIKYLYSVIEGYEEEIEDLRKKNSELKVQLKDTLETASFKEECLVSLEEKIDEIENKNAELKNRILEYSSKVNNEVMDPRPIQDAFSVKDLLGQALKQNILDHAIRMLNRLVHLDNTRENMNEYNYSKNRIIDGVEEIIKRANISFDGHKDEKDRADGLNRQVGVLRMEVWQTGQWYLKWKRKTHNEREAIIQHRRTIHNWLTRYNDDTEALRQRNDRNSRRARDLYQRDTTRLRREKNACIQQAQNWRGRERNAQNQINNLNQQIINLQNNPPQNIRMAAAYTPPTFSGNYDEDIGYFINEFRRYLTASGNALANAADHASALGLFKASLRGHAMEWLEKEIIGKNWELSHILSSVNLANINALQGAAQATLIW